MDEDAQEPLSRPPVALGCSVFVLLVVFAAIAGGFCIVFLESGARTKAVLDVPEAYAPGSVQFIPEHNLYLVALPDGRFLALNDLDADNRARPGQRCRVQAVGRNDPALARLLAEHRDEFSPAAAGANFLFRDPCAGTLYDLTGVRVGSEGLNLDRHDVGLDEAGHVTVDISHRDCTRREGDNFFAPVECPE